MRIYYAAHVKKFQLNTQKIKVKHNMFPSFHLYKMYKVYMTDTHAHMNLDMENKSGKGD